jgi:hypothetical protein
MYRSNPEGDAHPSADYRANAIASAGKFPKAEQFFTAHVHPLQPQPGGRRQRSWALSAGHGDVTSPARVRKLRKRGIRDPFALLRQMTPNSSAPLTNGRHSGGRRSARPRYPRR